MPILLSSGKPLVFIHVLASNSFILSSLSQPTVVFSKGTGSKLHLVHGPAICVYKPCLSFLLGFSISSEPIALPSSSEPFFSLFCTFNTRHGHIAPRAIKVTAVNFPCSLRKRLGTRRSYGRIDYCNCGTRSGSPQLRVHNIKREESVLLQYSLYKYELQSHDAIPIYSHFQDVLSISFNDCFSYYFEIPIYTGITICI